MLYHRYWAISNHEYGKNIAKVIIVYNTIISFVRILSNLFSIYFALIPFEKIWFCISIKLLALYLNETGLGEW